MTTTDINDRFSQYYTSNQVDTDFMKTEDLTDRFSKYYTSSKIDTTLQDYYTKTEAGDLFVEEEDENDE